MPHLVEHHYCYQHICNQIWELEMFCNLTPIYVQLPQNSNFISLSLGDQITTTLATSVLPVSSEQNS